MDYIELAYVHLATIFLAFLIGTFLLLKRKGTRFHKQLGKVYMLLMLFSASVTLFMSAEIGPTFLHHFGFIHLLSLLVFICVIAAYLAARNGNIKIHKANMLGLYIGGILVAGGFTFLPGRLLNGWVFG